MTVAVADSTPLIALSRIGKADILPAVLGSVLVPPAVIEEVLVAGLRYPGTAALRHARWIIRVSSVALISGAPKDLGRGELEAIAVAHVRDLAVLTDDRSAGAFALTQDVPVLRTLDVLAVAEEEGHIPDAELVAAELIAAGFRLHPKILAMFHDRMVVSRSRRGRRPRAFAA